MPALFIYLIKANIVLTLFYLAYRFGLRRLTFYTVNRYFLLSGILCAALFPLLNFQELFRARVQETALHSANYYAIDWNALQQQAASEDLFTIWNMLQYIFWTGVVVMLIRFLFQLFSLLKIHLQSRPGMINNEKIKFISGKINPFSFFKNLYINPALHSPDEIRTILSHEKIHMRQWHSLDVLAGEINHIFYWFNPGAWLMKKAIRENLEFITDSALLKSGMNAKKYQYILLKTVTGQQGKQLANNFNLSHLKNRIIMMNKKKSAHLHLLRYLLVLPLLVIISLLISPSKAQTTSTAKHPYIIQKTVISSTPPDDTIPESQKNLPDDYKAFLRRNPSINDIHWSDPVHGRATIAIIYFKNGEKDRIHLTDPAEVKKATEKYGKLPVPPTPPPPKPKVIYTPPKVTRDTFLKPKVKYTPPKIVEDDVIYHSQKKDDNYYAELALKNLKLKQLTKAENFANKALKINPDNETAQQSLKYISRIRMYNKKMEEYKKKHLGNVIPKTVIYYTPPKVVPSVRKNTNIVGSHNKTENYSIVAKRIHLTQEQTTTKNISLDKKARYIVDGKKTNSIEDLNPNSIKSITVLKDRTDTTVNGEGGVIIIHTKKEDKKIHSEHLHLNTNSGKNNHPKPTTIILDDRPKVSNPLYIVDNKEVDSAYFHDKISLDEIESIYVIKDKEAAKQYGKKGRNGIIKIFTKEYKKKHPQEVPPTKNLGNKEVN